MSKSQILTGVVIKIIIFNLARHRASALWLELELRGLLFRSSPGVFSEFCGIRILLLPIYVVQSWSCALVDGPFQASP